MEIAVPGPHKNTRSNKRRTVQRRGGAAAACAPVSATWTPVPSNSPVIDDTLAFWQPLSRRTLSREDAREIIQNVSGFFGVLQEWANKEDQRPVAADPLLDTSRTEGNRG